MVDKVIRDGKVAVLISPGYGSGWTTWNQNHKDVKQMLFDPDIVNAILEWEKADGKTWKQHMMKINEIANAKYNQDPYYCESGLWDVHVVWVDVGRKFIVTEYGGSESIQFFDEMNWITA